MGMLLNEKGPGMKLMQKWFDRGDRCGMCYARTSRKNEMESGWALVRNQFYCPRHADAAIAGLKHGYAT